MWATLATYIGGKVLTAILIVASLAGLYWFYRHPETLQAIWSVLEGVLVWMGFVLVLPWALFFLPAWVVKKESNLVAGLLLAGYLLLDVVVALWLAGWGGHGALNWTVLILGFLSAGVYNFLVCDYLAGRLDDAL